MFKRVTLLFLMCLAVMGSAWAESINASQARRIAEGFMAQHSMPATNLQLAKEGRSLNAAPDKAAYYVFNGERQQGGYVIVAGDDRVPAVLGYSDAGTFDADNIPEAMQELLDSYAEQIELLGKDCTVATHLTMGGAISPLVPCAWSQNAPFNVLFPFLSNGKHAYVGCVATAMAQVMYYYRWPVRPTATIPAYTTSSLGISMPALPVVDFNWDAMQDNYQTTDTTSVAALAASTLSLYCAQAMEMDFKTSGSGATTTRVPMKMATYFGYSGAAHALSRGNYTTEEWESTIYSELAAARPVLFSARKASSGHAFICDGYDGNGLFHINWGWNGQSNGYFLLNVLNPDLQGTGSASGAYGYIYSQAIIVGLEPGDATSNETILTASDVVLNGYTGTRTSSSNDFKAIVSGHFNNYTAQVLAVRFGWGLYQGDTQIAQLYSGYNSGLTPGKYLYSDNKELSFGSGLTNGTYRIVPNCCEYNSSTADWQPCAGADKNYIEVTISGNTCTFTGYGTAGTPDFTINSITLDGTMHPNRPLNVILNMTNEGHSSNQLFYMFIDGTFTSTALVSLENGETGDIPFRFMPTAAGTYTLTFSFNDDGSNPIATRTITINEMPAASLTATIQALDVTDATNKIITSNKFSVVLTITNTGSTTYDEEISAKLFKNVYGTSGTNVQGKIEHITLAPGETTTVQFDMDNVMDHWKYFLKTYYYSSGQEVFLTNVTTHTIIFPEAPVYSVGDVNCDGIIDITDVTLLINYVLTGYADPFNPEYSDLNDDGIYDITDITLLINKVLTGE